ncbi:MAG: lipid-transfer protein, partial [Dehalococcoidia bacterium]
GQDGSPIKRLAQSRDVNSIKDRCAIVGIGETEYSRNSGRSELSLAAEASRKAIEDAGLRPQDIDGIVRFAVDSTSEDELMACLGIPELKFYGELGYAGSAGSGLVAHAVMAIATGMATNVLLYRAMNGRSGRRYGAGAVTGRGGEGSSAFWEPFGLLVPGQRVAMYARRRMREYGTTSRQFGAVAVACRKHANMNPRALMYRRPLTIEDHQSSRMIYDPFRLYDCCLETDGGAAVVITSAERVGDSRHRPAYIMAAVQSLAPQLENRWSVTEAATRRSAARLFEMAGITPRDIDVAQIYDHFSANVIFSLEDLGLCKRGEGGPFVEEGGIEIGGELPVNTAGGHLSEAYVHAVNHIVEGVRQIRGASTAQVPDAELALVDSDGLGTLILRR